MTSDFLERTRFVGQGLAEGGILDRLRMQVAAGAATPRRRRRASSSSSLPPSRRLSAEESAELEGLAALPLADGAAVECVAGWLGRLAAGDGDGAAFPGGSGEYGPAGSGEEGGAETLQEVLLPLVIGLRRLGRLPAVLRELREASTTRLKDLLRWVAWRMW